ncbi:DUF4198 domain-containing protein [Phaeobacter sp.]|uniref:DUF4198 domain-containing protein n=1 Tax=Phaeobacter sp. TaxID=1902409 RepID=UPI0025DBA66C|nr:DUF4198 domain-containing protein [Phaeobacter sp.]
MLFLRPLLIAVASLVPGLLPAAALCHEFWVAPQKYQVKSGASVSADLRNGQNFNGFRLPYLDQNIARFETIQAGERRSYTGRLGDTPALSLGAVPDGLLTILHETRADRLTYEEWDKFAAFVEEKGLQPALAQHMARGLPNSGFAERYIRHAKALIGVGHGRGSDSYQGMELEFVAATNPYESPENTGVLVTLVERGADGGTPLAAHQITVFAKAPDGAVTLTTQHTDTNGQARISVAPGHRYLLDAVVLRPHVPTQSDDAVWQSHWAALTFAMP